jgi:hypothetical protein
MSFSTNFRKEIAWKLGEVHKLIGDCLECDEGDGGTLPEDCKGEADDDVWGIFEEGRGRRGATAGGLMRGRREVDVFNLRWRKRGFCIVDLRRSGGEGEVGVGLREPFPMQRRN